MLRLKAIALLATLLAQNAYSAECWIADNFKGYPAKVRNGYEFETDGMTSTKYVIYIDGKKSHIVGSSISEYLQIAPNSILAIAIEDDTSVIETWTIDPVKKKALYTKTTSGYGQFDGVSVFVGNVVGDCKSEKEKLQ